MFPLYSISVISSSLSKTKTLRLYKAACSFLYLGVFFCTVVCVCVPHYCLFSRSNWQIKSTFYILILSFWQCFVGFFSIFLLFYYIGSQIVWYETVALTSNQLIAPASKTLSYSNQIIHKTSRISIWWNGAAIKKQKTCGFGVEYFLCKHCVAAMRWNRHTELSYSDEINRNMFIFPTLKLLKGGG